MLESSRTVVNYIPRNGEGVSRPLDGWRTLPTLPAVLFRFLGLVADSGTSDQQLADLVWTDPALLARAMAAVHASPSARNLSVPQLRQEIAGLGRERLRHLAYTTPLLRSVEPMRMGFHAATFWERALLCGCAGEALAGLLGFPTPEQYYLAGLFHDIGYLRVLQEKPAALRTVIEQWTARSGDLLEIETTVFGMDHCRLGLELATQLELPAWLRAAIERHHCPSPDSHRITRLTAISSAFCSYQGIDFFPSRTLSPSVREREMKEIVRCLLPELPAGSASELLATMKETLAPVRNWISGMLVELQPARTRESQERFAGYPAKPVLAGRV